MRGGETMALRTTHVTEAGLAGRPDTEIWAHAARDGLIIVTKDADCLDLAIAKGSARVIHLTAGSLRARDLLRFVEKRLSVIAGFAGGDESILVLRE
jgi:predicted nuclease of predicted toxin-antitoxin system